MERSNSEHYHLGKRSFFHATNSTMFLTHSAPLERQKPGLFDERNSRSTSIRECYEELSVCISQILHHNFFVNDRTSLLLVERHNHMACFYSKCENDFSFQEYLFFVMETSEYSDSVFILALYYTLKVQKIHKMMRVSKWNVHRIYLTCVVLAAKCLEDVVFSNSDMANIGGFSGFQELNHLEILMLKLLKYDLKCDQMLFDVFRKMIMF